MKPYLALDGHLYIRRGYRPLHLAACWCWRTPLARSTRARWFRRWWRR